MDRILELLALLGDPEAIAALSDPEVADIHTELLELFASVRAGEIEGYEPTDVKVLTDLRDAAHSFEYLAAERANAQAAIDATIAELEASLTPDPDPEPEPEPDPEPEAETPNDGGDGEPETETAPEAQAEVMAEVEVVEVPDDASELLEPVVASTPASSPPRPALSAARAHAPARTRARPTPAPAPQSRLARRVGSERAADPVEFLSMLTEAFNDSAYDRPKNREKVRLARIEGHYAPELTLGSPESAKSDGDLIAAMVGELSRRSYWDQPQMQARVAAGGFCAPAEIDYEFAGVGSEARPVRDSLAPFNATRGSLQTPVPLKLTDIDVSGADAAVSIYTEEQDIASATKPQQCVPCNEFRESTLYAVTKRICFGNFGQRAWPELIDEFVRLAGVAHARLAETQMLDRIKALADETLETDRVFGAARDLAEAVARAAEAWRYRQRDPNVQLHAWFPSWVPAMGASDLVRANQTDKTLSELQGVFRSFLNQAGVNVTFYLDAPSTGTSQAFPAEVSGTLLNPWPTAVQWGLAEEGHYLALGQPPLDLGIYRDSSLVDTNQAEMFMETFEGVHKRGVLSQWITSRICVDGSWSDGADGSTVMGCAS